MIGVGAGVGGDVDTGMLHRHRIVRRAQAAGAWRFGMRMDGRFGRFGGAYVPEILVPALEQLEVIVREEHERVVGVLEDAVDDDVVPGEPGHAPQEVPA